MDKVEINRLLTYITKLYGFKFCELINIININPPTFKIKTEDDFLFLKLNSRPIFQKYMDIDLRYQIINKLQDSNIRIPKVCEIKKSLKDNFVYAQKGNYYFKYQRNEAELCEWIDFEPFHDSIYNFFGTIDLVLKTKDEFEKIYSEKLYSKEINECEIKDSILEYIGNAEFNHAEFNINFKKYMPKYIDLINDTYRILKQDKDGIQSYLITQNVSFIHADINLNNIGYIKNRASLLMDFERVRPGFAIEDIAMCMFELCIKDSKDLNIEKKVDDFLKYTSLQAFENVLFYILCNRLLRHIYRGIENLVKGRKLFKGFYPVFMEGLEKSYYYMTSAEVFNTNSYKTLIELEDKNEKICLL